MGQTFLVDRHSVTQATSSPDRCIESDHTLQSWEWHTTCRNLHGSLNSNFNSTSQQCNRTNTFIQLWRWRQQRSYPFLKKLPPWLHAPENPRETPVPAHLRHVISDSAPCSDTATRLRSQFKWELLFTAKRYVERINMRWRCP